MNTWNREWKPPRLGTSPDRGRSEKIWVLGNKLVTVPGDAFAKARDSIGDLAMKHVAFITYISTSVHERDVREIQIGA